MLIILKAGKVRQLKAPTLEPDSLRLHMAELLTVNLGWGWGSSTVTASVPSPAVQIKVMLPRRACCED